MNKDNKKHKIKAHTWKDGKLHKHESEHNCFEDALKFAKNMAKIMFHSAIKIYDEFGELLHSLDPCDDHDHYC